MKTKVLGLIVFVVVLSLFSFSVLADPEGPDQIDRGLSERRPTQAPVAVQAQAGNVTALSITATAVTNRWQGFYGNVTGNLTLEDAQGNSLYQWAVASPQGEIYAVNGSDTPVWTNVTCINMSDEGSSRVNLTEIESALGIDPNDVDGVNETFNLSFTGSFEVGTTSITRDSGCSAVSLNVNDEYDQTRFNETILTDNTTAENVIYVALLEQDAASFKQGPETADFQMIVGENGDTTDPSNYYFYVELT